MLEQSRAREMLSGKRLAFIVGAPRSGTTWLQLLLTRSAAIVTAQETHLFSRFMRSMITEWLGNRRTPAKTGINQVLNDEDVRDLLRGVSASVFAKMAQRKPSATVILEKTPEHSHRWREILELWPDAFFIHIVRDPRAVVASLCHASRTSWGAGWASSRVSPNCRLWVADVTQGRSIGSATSNYEEVKYEDLMSDGADVLYRLFTKLGIPSSRETCQGYFSDCDIENLKKGKLDNAPFDIAKMSGDSWRKGQVDGWRTELSRRQVALIERLAGAMMAELGYEPATARWARPIYSLLSMDHSLRDLRAAAKWRLRILADRL